VSSKSSDSKCEANKKSRRHINLPAKHNTKRQVTQREPNERTSVKEDMSTIVEFWFPGTVLKASKEEFCSGGLGIQ